MLPYEQGHFITFLTKLKVQNVQIASKLQLSRLISRLFLALWDTMKSDIDICYRERKREREDKKCGYHQNTGILCFKRIFYSNYRVSIGTIEFMKVSQMQVYMVSLQIAGKAKNSRYKKYHIKSRDWIISRKHTLLIKRMEFKVRKRLLHFAPFSLHISYGGRRFCNKLQNPNFSNQSCQTTTTFNRHVRQPSNRSP